MQTILITGGTGTIGKTLVPLLLKRGYHVIILTRKLPVNHSPSPGLSYASWDVTRQTIDIAAVQQADGIIHLAGAGVVDKKWTDAYKKEIQVSRTESSKLLITTLKNNAHKVKTIVSASAIGWYGYDAPGTKPHVETDAPSTDFLGETCRLWEESIQPAEELQIRLVKLRTGIVLSNNGGALTEFKKPVKLGIAAILGDGKQVVSWIHIDDLCGLYIAGLENVHLSGVYNAVAPAPVTNETLTLELAKQLKGKLFIPVHVPQFALKIMMGERSAEVLKSNTVSCEKIQHDGFKFLYIDIEKALKQLCNE